GAQQPRIGDDVPPRGEVPRGSRDAPVRVIGAALARVNTVVAKHIACGARPLGAGVGIPAEIGVGDDVALHNGVARDAGPGTGENDPLALSSITLPVILEPSASG